MGTPRTRDQLVAAVDQALRESSVDVIFDAISAATARGPGRGPLAGVRTQFHAADPLPPDEAYRHIFDASGLGIALVDAEGRPIRSNAALERILGYGRDELGRMAFPQFTHPDDVTLDAELFQELLAGTRQQYQIERRYVRKDGSIVAARLTVSLIPGGSRRAIAMVEDISVERMERARHAATLRSLEDRVSELTAIHDLSAVLRDSAQPLGEVLAGIARILRAASRVPSTSGVRVTLGDTVAEDGAFADASAAASVTFGAAAGQQGRIDVFHAHAPAAPASPDGGDGERRLLKTVADHVGAALERRRAEARLTLAVADGKVAVWELDLRTGTLTWPGQAPNASRPWPLDCAATLGAFKNLVHPDDLETVERELRAATDDPARKGRYQAEYRLVSPQGDFPVILASGQTIYDDDARPERMFGVAIDVTERRGLEGKLRQAQKLEAIGQLAGGVAHDFNNALCVILGYGQLVADGLGPAHAFAPQVEQIVKAGHVAEALTRQLLAFSRRQVVEPRLLDLNRVIRGVEGMLRRLIGEDVALVTELASEPAVVRADAGQLEQVLVNLAVNARDAMPKGGHLTIRTRFEAGGGRSGTLGTEIPGGPFVVLSVTDTGIGMDAATRARVFEPFFTTKPLGSGTGLGLAIVHGIVSQSGGVVGFVSEPGQGTEFHIHLPRLALAAEDDEHAPVDLRAYEGRETVLVAEDQEPVRQILRIWLERRGYRVLEAADGKAGVDVAKGCAARIDLLVTDVVMPRANGRELASALRASDPDLPVIYISGYTSEAIAQRGALEPGVRLLDKPLSEAVLLRAVREGLDGARGGGRHASRRLPPE